MLLFVAYALQTCMEPIFCAIYAYFAAGERLTAYGYVGPVLKLAGMIMSEVLPDREVTDVGEVWQQTVSSKRATAGSATF